MIEEGDTDPDAEASSQLVVPESGTREPLDTDPRWVHIAFSARSRLDSFAGWCGKVSLYLTVVLLAVGFLNVVLRYYGRETNQAIVGEQITDIQWMLFGLVFLFGFPYILREDINVRVDFYYSHFDSKRKSLVNALGNLLFLVPFCIMGVYLMVPETLRAAGQRSNGRWPSGWRIWETWSDSGNAGSLPTAPIHLMLTIGFVLLGLQALAELTKAVFALRGYEHLVGNDESDSPLRVE